MTFFTPTKDFTHYGRFYGVPIYLNLDNEACVVAGSNRLFDLALLCATWFHNAVMERCAQAFAAAAGQEYMPGFPFKITGEME